MKLTLEIDEHRINEAVIKTMTDAGRSCGRRSHEGKSVF